MNVSRFWLVRVALACLVALLAILPAASAQAATSPLDFRNAMRKLWEDHVTWTRLYIVSAEAGLPDTGQTAQRLFQNQVDIGNAIKPFYGEDAGNKLAALLHDHIQGAADLIAAAKAGDNAKVQTASTAWYANANDIATFLNGANPKNWPLDTMKAGMKMHLDLTLDEATARLKGDYAADIKDYDKVHEHILGLADTLTSGIVAQFPDKFATAVGLPASGAGPFDELQSLAWLFAALSALFGFLAVWVSGYFKTIRR